MRAILAIAFLLTACQAPPLPPSLKQPTALVGSDLATASAIAKAAGDAPAQACWDFLATILPAVSSGPGAATAYELARLPTQPAFAVACGPIGFVLPAGTGFIK
jgi:hypothetical protein